jgi:hypothetical protein
MRSRIRHHRWVLLPAISCSSLLGLAVSCIKDPPADEGQFPDARPAAFDSSPVTPDAPVADSGAACGPSHPFGAPTEVTELTLAGASSTQARLSFDGRQVVFTKLPSDGGASSLLIATRTDLTSPFQAPSDLVIPGFETAANASPSLTGDNRALYFQSTSASNPDILVATRTDAAGPFPSAATLPAIDTAQAEVGPYVLSDHSALYFGAARDPAGGVDAAGPLTVRIFRSPVATGFIGPGVEINLGGVAFAPVVSPDELTIFFSSNRTGTVGVADVWTAHRANKTDSFGTPTNVAELNVAGANQAPTFITADGCSLYLQSDRTGGSTKIYRATRTR